MWWQILGVEENADLKTIKRAYAKLIKQAKPEENAEEFMRINRAFNEAKKHHMKKSQNQQKKFNPSQAKERKKINVTYRDQSEEYFEKEPPELEEYFEKEPPELEEYFEKEPPELEEYFEKESLEPEGYFEKKPPKVNFKVKIKSLYYDIAKRNNLTSWTALTQDLSFEEEEIFDEFIISFLKEHYALESKLLNDLYQKYFGEDVSKWSNKIQLLVNHPLEYNFTPVDGINEIKLITYYEVVQELYIWAMGLDVEIKEKDYRECFPIAVQLGGLGLYFFLKYASYKGLLDLSNQFNVENIINCPSYNDSIKEQVIDIYLKDEKIDEAYALTKDLINKNKSSVQYKLKLDEIKKNYICLQTEKKDLSQLKKIKKEHRILEFKKYPLSRIEKIKILKKVDLLNNIYNKDTNMVLFMVMNLLSSLIVGINEIYRVFTGLYGHGIGDFFISLVIIIFCFAMMRAFFRRLTRGAGYV